MTPYTRAGKSSTILPALVPEETINVEAYRRWLAYVNREIEVEQSEMDRLLTEDSDDYRTERLIDGVL